MTKNADEALQRLSPAENTAIGIAAGLIDVSTTQWFVILLSLRRG